MDPIDEKISKNLPEIELILNRWGFVKTNIPSKFGSKLYEIKKWFHNFRPSEFDDALLILSKIIRYQYEDFQEFISSIAKKLTKDFDGNFENVAFYGLGESTAASGYNFLHELLKELDISENHFPLHDFRDLKNFKHFIFIDDIIGSGNQATKFSKEKLSSIKYPTLYIALLGLEDGISNVRANSTFDDVLVGKILSSEYQCFTEESQIFEDQIVRKRLEKMCQKYGNRLYPGHALGYDDSQLLINLYYNTPNNSLPIIWAGTKNEKSKESGIWNPVFERRKRGVQKKYSKNHKKIFVGNLPQTNNVLFGRKSILNEISRYRESSNYNIITIIAKGGIGKTALLNNWILNEISKSKSSFEKVFAWSFYTQGTTQRVVSADLFMESALNFFDFDNTNALTSYEKGVLLAKYVASGRNILLLDGLEPLQYPFGKTEGYLKDNGLKALFTSLSETTGKKGICILTSRIEITEFRKFYNFTVKKIDLPKLSDWYGAKLLKHLGVKGSNKDLKEVSKGVNGHSLLLYLIGNYLKHIYQGQLRYIERISISNEPTNTVRHFKKALGSYEQWLEGKIELSILYTLAFFDRPVNDRLLENLRGRCFPKRDSDEPISINIANLRKLGLIYNNSDKNGLLDMHPLVREYFHDVLIDNFEKIYVDGNNWLYHHYKEMSVSKPENLIEVEELILAMSFACKAGLYNEGLKDIYISRLMHFDEYHAVTNLSAYSQVLFGLSHFFEDYEWKKIKEIPSKEDKLYLLKEAAKYLNATEGYASENARLCFSSAKTYITPLTTVEYKLEILLGECRYYRLKGHLTKSKELADEVESITNIHTKYKVLSDRALSSYYFYVGDFRKSLTYSNQTIKIYPKKVALKYANLDLNEPMISCKGYTALNKWFLGEHEESISLALDTVNEAKELNHMHTEIIAIFILCLIYQLKEDKENLSINANRLKNRCTQFGFPLWEIAAKILIHWTKTNESSISQMEDEIKEWHQMGGNLFSSYWLLLQSDKLLEFGNNKDAIAIAQKALSYSEQWCHLKLYKNLAYSYKSQGDSINYKLMIERIESLKED